MAPLVGDVGVQLLFVRSAKLSRGEFSSLAEISILQGSTKLRECLQTQDAVATESAAVLFGTFFALVTTFLGERLTSQVLLRAWPTLAPLEETPPREKKNE